MFSFYANLEKEIQAAGFTGETPNDPQNPSVGIYLTEQNPSKMGWYIKRTATIEKTRCDASGATYHVEYTLNNTMKVSDVANLPPYITGVDAPNRGKGIEKILKKVGEESTEAVIGAMKEDYNETVFEISDLVYHVLVLMVEMGIDLSQVRQELENRHVVDKKVKQERMQ